MAQSEILSPAGRSLGLGGTVGSIVPNESEEQRRRRLAALQAARNSITGALSPAGAALLGSAVLAG